MRNILIIILLSTIGFYSAFSQTVNNSDKGSNALQITKVSKNDSAKNEIREYTKPEASTKIYKGKKSTFAIATIDSLWNLVNHNEADTSDIEFQFAHKKAEVFGTVSFFKKQISIEAIKVNAIKNINQSASGAEIIDSDFRIVNWNKIFFLKIKAKVKGSNFFYYYYYLPSKLGTLEVLTYTSEDLLPQYEKDMFDFLNGIAMITKRR